MLKLYNTQTRQKEDFVPLQAGKVGLYVCGMTIYDYCHIGHARMLVAFDVVQRWLRTSGYAVTYVRNITDIDDKIIKRAVENNETIGQLTNRFIQYMNEDLTALGVQTPDHEPKATHYVPQMLQMIEQLVGKGLAYQVKVQANTQASAAGVTNTIVAKTNAGSVPANEVLGDVNFAVRKLPGYGKLSGKSLDDLRAGERVDVDRSKDDPLDFVLWKCAKETEPEGAKWPSKFGLGRPGWHIECSAMSTALLGNTIDIHGGGADLQFPHHENEIAQSEGANGCNFVRYWLHNGFVRVDNEKMSKSLHNFFTIRDVLKEYDAEVVRFFLMRAQYRSPINYSNVSVEDARQGLLRLYTALSDNFVDTGSPPDFTNPSGQAFQKAMDDDFNTPIACAVLFDLATELNREKSPSIESQLRALAKVLGLLGQVPKQALQSGLRGASVSSGLSDAQIDALITERAEAKKAKNFSRADEIRKQLIESTIVLEDSASGTTWRRA
jgi:cysteinyl-tRNA synthetase